MAIFPVDTMADRYARSICEKLKSIGEIEDVDKCVTKVKEEYKKKLSDIDNKWAEGLKTRWGV